MWRSFVLIALFTAPLFIAPLFIIPGAHAADNKDWVLEQRFKKQIVAAQNGNKEAQLEIGRMYEKGRGVDQNMKKAIEWLGKSATQGQPTAKAELGIIYFEGKGVAPDYTKAFSLLSAAAANNIPNAQFFLGRIYEEGKGTHQNLDVALKWYREAAKNGYYPATARVRTLEAKLAAAPSPASKHAQASKSNADNATRKTVLAGSWVHGKRPTSYLPSSVADCTQKDNGKVQCISKQQTRTVGPQVITYRTRARLSDFKPSGEFAVAYTNEIVKVTAAKKDAANETDAEAAKRTAAQHEVEHTLSCRLENAKRIACVKDKFLNVQFTNTGG